MNVRADRRAAPFLAVAGDAPVADRDEILRLLSVAVRAGSVPAMKLMLDELRRDEAAEVMPALTVVPEAKDFISELAERAKERGTDG